MPETGRAGAAQFLSQHGTSAASRRGLLLKPSSTALTLSELVPAPSTPDASQRCAALLCVLCAPFGACFMHPCLHVFRHALVCFAAHLGMHALEGCCLQRFCPCMTPTWLLAYFCLPREEPHIWAGLFVRIGSSFDTCVYVCVRRDGTNMGKSRSMTNMEARTGNYDSSPGSPKGPGTSELLRHMSRDLRDLALLRGPRSQKSMDPRWGCGSVHFLLLLLRVTA